jgi:hypothetical protein
MADIGAFLSAKRLGAPTWLWATGGVALVAGAYLYYKNKKATAATATTGTNTSSAAGSVAGITQPTGYPQSVNKSTSNYYTNPPTTPTAPTTDTSGIPGFLQSIAMSQYTVKGTNTNYKGGVPSSTGYVTDNWPDGIASVVYQLDPQDYVNHASDAVLIEMSNPTVLPPYPVGTTINYPTNGPSGWVPAPQTTSLTTTAAGSPTTSASGS